MSYLNGDKIKPNMIILIGGKNCWDDAAANTIVTKYQTALKFVLINEVEIELSLF